MKRILFSLSFIISMLFVYKVLHCENLKKDTIKTEESVSEIGLLRNEIKAIREGQLNYKIEKDLLKETYSVNYDRIQITITFILGMLSLFGFYSIFSFSKVKKECEGELKGIKDMKVLLEKDVSDMRASFNKDISAMGESISKEMSAMRDINIKQNTDIQVIDIRRKIMECYRTKDYGYALKYIEKGLEIIKDDIDFLRNKAECFVKLRKYDDSIKLYEKIYLKDNENVSIISNLIELYLLKEKFDKSNELIVKHKKLLEPKKNLIVYYDFLKWYLMKKEKELLSSLNDFLKLDSVKKNINIRCNYIGAWDFSDLYYVIERKENDKLKMLLMEIVKMLKGEITAGELQKYILDNGLN
ncbi:MAG: hypothetical protein WC947_03270 [Elusimicrobiota bacterium]